MTILMVNFVKIKPLNAEPSLHKSKSRLQSILRTEKNKNIVQGFAGLHKNHPEPIKYLSYFRVA